MAEPDETQPDEVEETGKKKGKLGLVITLVLSLLLAGGGFFATFSGMLDPILGTSETEAESHPTAEPETVAAPTFLELDPLVVTVGSSGSIRQLRFRAFLQLHNGPDETVAALRPRILDIFATYLRAVPVDRLEDPTALLHLRAQLLRRIQLLVGPDSVRDLLIVDFVIT
ncbi:flagellar basal body-associated FliL family protein [Jannaschia pohangensis]|uniref:Flagellar protein FliL n=1 Tax=Jannaschia pohangensis TaxID=390807 RepID=A0A1I3RAH3_9RHOB|nr:flagellar basal body-associated FliL family protein [Jannaschia pohangensis]SFJ42186.1 flagellar FliL protein [Jannaschia pohangensis]